MSDRDCQFRSKIAQQITIKLHNKESKPPLGTKSIRRVNVTALELISIFWPEQENDLLTVDTHK
jgi:hypothetical protein